MNKTIFITGASSGIGKATAKQFASEGWNVIATMRNPQDDDELKNIENVDVLALDVTNPEQVEKVVKSVIDTHNIDVVFNNAGYGLSGPLETLSDERIIKQLNTNFIGVVRVTRTFVPYFKQRKSGLFLTTTSMAGVVGLPFNSIYCASKWALEGFAEALYYELHPYNIQVKTIAPGAVYTDFGMKNIDASHLPEYDDISKKYMEYMLGDMTNIAESMTSADYIANTVFDIVNDNKDQIRYIAGKDAEEMYSDRMELGNDGFRRKLSGILFEE